MFGKLMNGYYYGKSGKGDYTPDDLPRTRLQLFMEMLRVRLNGLCRMNFIYLLVWLPAIVVIGNLFIEVANTLNIPYTMNQAYAAIMEAQANGTVAADGSIMVVMDEESGNTATYTAEMVEQIIEFNGLDDGEVALMQVQTMEQSLLTALLWLIPCLFITGPWTAGVAYVTRNWARDEHAFIWSDMKDAMKENWKQALGVSAITAVLPAVTYLCWVFYGEMTATMALAVVPQILIVMLAFVWSLAVTYAYPMMVTYHMSFMTIIRNSLLLAVGRLPMSIGVRLLHCVPAAIALLITYFTGSLFVPLLLLVYYVVLGFCLSRFVTASYTNAQFDRYFNSRIEGAKVNRGMADEEDEEDDEEEEERELKPWENGYTDR